MKITRSHTSVAARTLNRHYVIGAAAIGRELGCSAITVRRMVADGRLKVFRTGSHTSPIKMWLRSSASVVEKPKGVYDEHR